MSIKLQIFNLNMWKASLVAIISLYILGATLISAQNHDGERFVIEEFVPRLKRQISFPPPQQAPQPPAGAAPQAGNGGMFGFLSDLGPQVERVKQFSSIFSSVSGSPQSSEKSGLEQAGGNSGASATQLLGQLSELMRSSQTRNNQLLSNAQQDGQQMAQQGVAATQSTQKGLQAALTEMIQGVQRIAMNNPLLLPEVKNLFQSVSSRLSSATPGGNQITPAKNADQLVDNLGKVALSPQSA